METRCVMRDLPATEKRLAKDLGTPTSPEWWQVNAEKALYKIRIPPFPLQSEVRNRQWFRLEAGLTRNCDESQVSGLWETEVRDPETDALAMWAMWSNQ